MNWTGKFARRFWRENLDGKFFGRILPKLFWEKVLEGSSKHEFGKECFKA